MQSLVALFWFDHFFAISESLTENLPGSGREVFQMDRGAAAKEGA